MKPALKAMVEAMLAEVQRQGCSWPGDNDPRRVGLRPSAELDLDKVARAGLAAIRVPDPAVLIAGSAVINFHDLVEDHDDETARALSAMIDEILKETP